MRAGDWEVDDATLAAMGLSPEGGDDSAGGDGFTGISGEQEGFCGPSAPAKGGPGASRHGSSRLDAPQASRAPQTSSASTSVGGSAAMWQHVLGERSTAVGKLARVSAPKGVRLRTGAAANQPDVGILPFDELLSVERRTEHGWCWVVPMGAHAGSAGFCEQQFLAIDPPEPTAHLVRVAPGEQLRQIAQRHYGQHIDDDHDARLYVQALVEANRGRKGIFLSEVELTLRDRVLRGDDEERTLKTYLGAHVREGHTLWMPSEAFIEELRKRGDITSGSTELSQAWRRAKKAVSASIDAGTYGAAFVVGLLEGSWNAVTELFQGAAEMIELVAKTAYQVITGNLGAITAALMGWIEKLKGAWAGRDKLADAFMRKWESEDAWVRGNFQGEVLGWVMMTVLLILATAGTASLAVAGGRWASVLQALRTLDALGDITTYVGAAARLPAKALSHLRGRLGIPGKRAAATLGTVESSAEQAIDASRHGAPGEHITVQGHAQSPRHQWRKNPGGELRSVEQAIELAHKHGIEVPDDVLLRRVAGKYLPPNALATYFSASNQHLHASISWEDFYDKRFDQILVAVDSAVFESDEAIIAILSHEMHELNNLRRIFEERGGRMTAQQLHYLINPGIKGNLHDQAWDVADAAVDRMRKGSPQ